jgi:sec-independent protein translocase protein TatB
MFDVAWSELLIIAVVAIVVVGPKDLPRLMRTFGHYAGKMRRAAADFQRQFNEAMREAEVDEVRKAIESVRATSAQTAVDLKAPIDKPLMLPANAAPSVAQTQAAESKTPAATPAAGPLAAEQLAAEAKPKPAKRARKPKAQTGKDTNVKDAGAKDASVDEPSGKTKSVEGASLETAGTEPAAAKPSTARRRKKKAEGTA